MSCGDHEILLFGNPNCHDFFALLAWRNGYYSIYSNSPASSRCRTPHLGRSRPRCLFSWTRVWIRPRAKRHKVLWCGVLTGRRDDSGERFEEASVVDFEPYFQMTRVAVAAVAFASYCRDWLPPYLGELAYCKGDAVMVSNEVVPDGPGEAAVLPMSCAPEGYSKINSFSICEATERFCMPRSNCSLLELSSISISGNSFDDNITGSAAVEQQGSASPQPVLVAVVMVVDPELPLLLPWLP
nr:hypothetical protein Iba_chr01cCG11580 [Ipomoea batatas]